MNLKKLISVVIALAMLITLVPVSFADDVATVYVTVENNVYSVANGAPWEGKKLDMAEVEIEDGTTKIVDVLLDALEEAGLSQTGAESGYISEIDGLSEMDGSSMAGWTITLNDWFTSAGIDNFYVSDGDLIKLSFTSNFGEDLGSPWGNNDKSVSIVEFSEGTLDKEFEKDTYEYTLTVPAETDSVKVTPIATNKNFQTRIYVNTEVNDEGGFRYIEGEADYESSISGLAPWQELPENINYYKRTESVPVNDGDVITVACGLNYWSTMNSGEFGSDAESVDGCVYSFIVEKEEEEAETVAVNIGVYDYTAVTYKEENPAAEIPVSENGIIHETTGFEVEAGTNALDALKSALDAEEIPYTIASYGTYLSSVNGLSEMDCTNESGWMISINDEFPMLAASDVTVQEGDTIKLHYSVKGWGTDVGSYFTGGPVVEKITLGGIETIISSNTVYADENDWTGTTTYYLGKYEEGGKNTPLEGDGSAETPFVIPVKVKSSTKITELVAELETSLHEKYLELGDGEGLSDILSETDYKDDVTFALQTLGGFYKTYYTVKVTKPSSSGGGGGGSGSSSVKTEEDKEPEKENTNVVIDTATEVEKTETEEAESVISGIFNDTKDHWAEDYISTLASKNIINGKAEGVFAPEDKITRAEIVSLLYRLSGEETVTNNVQFSDVNASDWYASAIAWATQNSVANGISENEFAPNEFVTREQIAVLVMRFCETMSYELKETSSLKTYTDEEKISPWARDYLDKAAKCGIIGGFEDGTVVPQGDATRAQVAKILCTMLDNIQTED